ncbi:MAG TPA: cytochrome o ubiquinol oxidase subunit IV [Steroidobacteraceae bacterium]|nr:cytochrome o ubiquinol oxidase subunit IV [Steroidobacteraceae bacterium]
MTEHSPQPAHGAERPPGAAEADRPGSILLYTTGLVFALLLTGASFLVSQTHLLWGPGVPAGLAVLAIAQMGVHLVFFLHISTGPDNTNNVVALAFGLLIVTLIVSGTLWIMAHLDANMVPVSAIMEMTR